MNKVKVISGWSEKGGSTTALINLTNYFNEHGIECTFYGPHNWHLDKCKSDLSSNFKFEPDDKIIAHYMKFNQRPNVDKIVLSCHEKWWFEVADLKPFWDEIVFLHKQHKDYHFRYLGDYSIIPNFKEDLKPKEKQDIDLIAGIIGTIETRKQTHLSIDKALKDGCKKIIIFGHIGDEGYYNQYVKHLIDNEVVFHMNYQTNKQEMYDSIGRVYHMSKGEVACLVKDECYLTNTKFFGNKETENEVSTLTNEEIFKLWKQILDI